MAFNDSFGQADNIIGILEGGKGAGICAQALAVPDLPVKIGYVVLESVIPAFRVPFGQIGVSPGFR